MLGIETRHLAALCIGAAWITCPLVQGQSAVRSAKATYTQPHEVPSAIRPILIALGSRFQTPGKERIVTTGQLRRKTGTSTVQIVNELPGKVRIVESGGRSRSLAFDLAELRGKDPIDDDDQDLMESMGIDSPEQFMQSLGAGVSLRLIGQRFQVAGETGFGGEVDIFEVTAPVNARKDKLVRTKQVMFDSRTMLLRRVVYTASKGNQTFRTETIHSDYTVVDGHSLAGRTQRLENGVEVFQFTRQSASIVSAAADNLFRIP